MAEEKHTDPKKHVTSGEHFIVNVPADMERRELGRLRPETAVPPPDIVSEPSGELRVLQQEVSGLIKSGSQVGLGDISDDLLDIDAALEHLADQPRRELPSYVADGDVCEDSDVEPVLPELDLGAPDTGEPSRSPASKDQEESTLVGGEFDPTVDKVQDLSWVQHARQLSRLREQIAQCTADPDHNHARINFDRFGANLIGMMKAPVFDRELTVVRTRKNLFVLSNESLLEFQDAHQELMGIDLTRSSVLISETGKLVHVTVVTAADLDVMQRCQTAEGRLSVSCIEQKPARVGVTDTLVLPSLDLDAEPDERVDAGFVDLEEFKAKVARGARVPGSVVFFDPEDFARKIEFVMSFYDDQGRGYYLVTTLDGGVQQSHLMVVEPRMPDAPDMSNVCFTYGEEFCTLVPED
jgi:hypothetical protein